MEKNRFKKITLDENDYAEAAKRIKGIKEAVAKGAFAITLVGGALLKLAKDMGKKA